MFKNTFLIQSGYKATLVADANLVGGYYQELGNPGETPGPVTNVAAGETVQLGPYNGPKFFGWSSTAGNIAETSAFSGWADFSSEPPATVNGGTIATAAAATTTKEDTVAVFKRTVLHLEAAPITITDDAGVIQYGGLELFDFPQGNVIILSAKAKGNLTGGVTGTIINAFTGNMAIGTTTAAAGATLATTQSDILPATAMATAVNKVAAVDMAPIPTIPNSGARWADGRSAAKKAFLNVKIADDATHTGGSATFTGDVELIWTVSEVAA